MKPAPFGYERASSLDEAVGHLGQGATVLAGGQSLIAQMALRQVRPSLLVDINEIPGLSAHAFPRTTDQTVVLGATCRQETLASWRPSDARWRAVPQAASAIGNYVTRTRGTVGGGIAQADPAGELPLLLLLFDGEVMVRSASGQRLIAASELFRDSHKTTLAADELITEVRLAPPPAGAITTFRELSERAAVAGVGVGLATELRRCTWCRIALCGVAPTPMRAWEAESKLVGSELTASDVEDAVQLAAMASRPRSDTHGSAAFRRALVAALVRRNLADAMRQLNLNRDQSAS